MIDKPNPLSLSTDLLLLILRYLDARDLCRAAQVSWSWYYIIKSLDNTTWKRIFLRDFSGIFKFRSALIYFQKIYENKNELINEDYLMNTFTCLAEEKSWKDLYSNHFIWKRLWKLRSEEVLSFGCIIRPLYDKSEIHVGPLGFHYTSIREAMANVHPYCTMIVHPGNYEEQIKISILTPFQLIGSGLNSPITLYFDCDTSAVRMYNLSLKSPWFSEFLLKVRKGFVQLESCNIMNGEIHVTSPGVLAMRYCSLENAKITFIRSSCSTIEHCEFNNNIDFNDFIHIEGAPKFERTTVCSFLQNHIKKWLPSHSNKNDDQIIKIDQFENYHRLGRKFQSCFNLNFPEINKSSYDKSFSQILRNSSKIQFDISKIKKIHTQVNLSLLKERRILHLFPHDESDSSCNFPYNKNNWKTNSFDDLSIYGLKRLDNKELTSKSISKELYSQFIAKCCQKQEIKQIINNINGPLVINCIFSNSKLVINCMFEANVIVMNCEMENCEHVIRLYRLSKAFIYHNRIHHCTGSAICLKHQTIAVIMGNEIYAMGDGAIEVRKNTFPYILANKIHSNDKNGISFISNKGLVEYNDIYHNKVGISILHSANPIIRSNTVRANKSHGVIISERSISILDDNLIMLNSESNVTIRKMSTPVISSNCIYHSQNDGIRIEDGSKGTIANNVIMGNVKNGVSLFNADLPHIYGNQIFQNNVHGIHVFKSQGNNDVISMDDHDKDVENYSFMSYCDSTSSLEFDEFGFSGSNDDLSNLAEDLSKTNSGEKWTRRKHSLLHIEFNSIYSNLGCGILNETNIALEILNNAIHANGEHGICLAVPGVFSASFGSPKLFYLESNNKPMKRLYIEQTTNILNTFLLEINYDEQRVRVINNKVTPYKGDNYSLWKMCHRTLGQILKNSITNNGDNGILINNTQFSGARFVIIGNGLYDNKGNGLSVDAECEIIDNDIFGNHKASLHTKSSSWIYLIMNRMHSDTASTINISEKPITFISKSNIVYTSALQSDIIHVIADKKLAIQCMDAFRLANIIECLKNNISVSDHIKKLRSTQIINSKLELNKYPLRPIIVKDSRYIRVSIALSEALDSFNKSHRSEICQIL